MTSDKNVGAGGYTRRSLLKHGTLALGMAALGSPGLLSAAAPAAASYPTRAVRFVIPFPAGTGTDATARIFARAFSEATGQSVVVENKPGGNGFIAVQDVLNSAADGYTIFIGSNSTLATNAAVFKRIPYDPLKDFAPISFLIQGPCLVVVAKDSPFHSLQDLAAAAKARPGKLNYGSGSISYQLNTEWLNQLLGIKAEPIPYKGANEALLAAISGEVDYAVVDGTSGTPQVQSGQVRALVYSGDARSRLLPDVPASAQAGIDGYLAYNWVAAAVSARTPPEITARIQAIFQSLSSNAALRDYYASQASTVSLTGPEEMRRFQEEEIVRWRDLMQKVGLEPQ
ncbi:Bug family tripartite tricarboxylate transporter substrate binding protein [Verticiella alkaliphila]|uniref:Bug family tripartite tricarboxylate transporter substrate binding protein n=1 Tax=Verticiella alkaliphila TaxID=2779529 RepID=UPI00209B5928|nr:tripartite tricarboxylate transporter substrate binding protein [Verticiella sp. GG226]